MPSKLLNVRQLLLLLAWLLAALLLSACAAVDALDAQLQPDSCADDSTVLFDDNFESENNRCGWSLYDDGSEAAKIEDGALQIGVGTNGFVAWTNPEKQFQDVEISVQTRQLSGPNNNAFGVICRYVDEDNFYIFLISGDGFYAIGKYQSNVNNITYLTGESPNNYVPSDAINQAATTNQIRVLCQGDQLAMYVNGFLLDEVQDDTFSAGDIGLAASVLEPGRAIIEFDNVRVVAP